MRFLAFSALTVAFLATVSSKINFGPCRTDIPQLAFDDYEPDGPYEHRIFGMDAQLVDFVDFIGQLGFVMPFDYQCDDLSTFSPFADIAKRQYDEDQALDTPTDDWDEVNFLYDDEDEFNLIFPDREDAILKYVSYEDFSDSFDQLYFCVDTFSLDAIIEQNMAFGLERTSISGLFVSLTSLFGIFEKLNWTFRVHGGILAGDFFYSETGHSLIDGYIADISTIIPGYSLDNYAAIQGDIDACPDNTV